MPTNVTNFVSCDLCPVRTLVFVPINFRRDFYEKKTPIKLAKVASDYCYNIYPVILSHVFHSLTSKQIKISPTFDCVTPDSVSLSSLAHQL